MRRALLALALSLCLATPACTRMVQDPTGAAVTAEEAGPFPEDYETIVRRWAVRELSRLSSIDEVSVPRPTPGFWERKGLGADTVTGWVTRADISGRDRAGLATGRVTYQLLIRDGEVVESRYEP